MLGGFKGSSLMQQHAQTVFISPKTELTTSPTRCRDNATALHTTLGARGRNRFAPVLENEMSNGEGNSRKRQLFIKKQKEKFVTQWNLVFVCSEIWN